MNKKAQVWIVDFMIGFIIFGIGMILASRFIFNSIHDNDFTELKSVSETISEYLLSEGVPANWTNETVVKIGLTTNKRLNITKLLQLKNISYNQSKIYLNSNYDYLFYFKKDNLNINITNCSFGYAINCDLNISTLNYENLVKTNRFIIFNKSIIELVLYTWK